MSIEQTLSKLQNIIHETLPNLELFVDHTVQPSAKECETLQQQLVELQDKLSVYKHLKTHKELSPSFGIHSKVSEAIEVKNEIKTTTEIKKETVVEKNETQVNPVFEQTNVGKSKKLEIALNQKFQFINELFNQNVTEYSLAIDQLNNCDSWADAESYLFGLRSVYNWKDHNETYKRFKDLCKKRFD